MSDKRLFKVQPGRGISSQKHGRDFLEGEIVDLSHASGQEIADLLATGAVVEVFEEELPAPPIGESEQAESAGELTQTEATSEQLSKKGKKQVNDA